MTWSNTWGDDRAAVRKHYADHTDFADDRINSSLLGGKPFKPPGLPNLTGMNSTERKAALAAVVWVRLEMVAAGRGSARLLVLGADSPTETRGQILRRIFYPDGYGDDFLTPIVDAEMEIFHPSHQLANSAIRFEETEEPESIPADPDSPKWASIEIATNYFAHRQIAAA